MFPHIFARMSALTQAARQGLSARIRFTRANMILNLAFCFSRPRYRVFRKRSCFFTTPNTCSTFARTDDFACSASLTTACSSLLSFFIWDGRVLILYWIFGRICFPRRHPRAFQRRDSRCHRRLHPHLRSTAWMLRSHRGHLTPLPPPYAPIRCPCPRRYALCSRSAMCCPFHLMCLRIALLFLVLAEDGAAMMVESTIVPFSVSVPRNPKKRGCRLLPLPLPHR